MSDKNYNADELVAPSWLNAQFLEHILANYLKEDQLKVLHLRTSPATVKGDHYASVMFRVNVDYVTKVNERSSKSLIVKTMPEFEGFKKEQLGESHIFQTEIGMYTEILPKFEAILREAGEDVRLHAPCLYCSLAPRQVMIFEDLVPLGYMVVRDREPTLEEVKGAYTKLAKWHAVGYKLHQEQPDLFEKFKYSIMELPKIMEDPFMSGLDYFIRLLNEIDDLQVYTPHFQKIRANYLETFRAPMVEYRENRQKNAYYLLCHGDLYLRNMMFKHNSVNGTLEDCMLLDFQMSNMGPMPNDIIYSIYQMLSPDQRLYHRDELIDFYFANFTQTLRSLKYQGEFPNISEFRNQMFRQRHLEIFLLTTFLPLMYSIKSKLYQDEDAIEMRYKDDVRQSFYRIEGYVVEVRRHLKRFLQEGYFD